MSCSLRKTFEPGAHLVISEHLLASSLSALASIVNDIRRYSALDIEIADSSLEQLRITGTVFEHDVDNWLRTLEAAFPIEISESAATSDHGRKRIVLRPARKRYSANSELPKYFPGGRACDGTSR